MSFSEVLKAAAEEVKGVMGAMIVGMDGIIVEQYSLNPGIDLQSVGAEYGNILKEVQNASESLRMGKARELAVITDTAGLILRKINEDYFAALVLSPGGGLGKARFVVRKAVGRLEKEF